MDPEFQVIDVAPGLWIWRMPHPDWAPPDDGDRVVTSTVASSVGEVAVLDPLMPPLQVWGSPWHEQAVLPALRAFLELPFEHVIISHGSPIHDRAEFERALRRPPFGGNF